MPKITASLPIFVLDFEPPLIGMDSKFNTFRLGRKWSTLLKKGDHVLLMDAKAKSVFGRAQVTDVYVGKLVDMAFENAAGNHNQLGKGESEAAEDLLERMRRRFGPHIATDTKTTTVIYLKRTR
jgi:hypothetical protein